MANVGNAITALRQALSSGAEEKALSRIATEPEQKRAMDQFRKAIAKAPDIKTALKDPRVLQVVTTALGIPDGATQPGLAMRALLSDPSDTSSLVNRLSDTRWKDAAEALQLGTKGLDALRDPKVQATLQEGLQRAQWQDDLEEQQTGLGDAVVFQERAAAVDGNIYAVLGDPLLRRVITGALGLPDSIALQSVETQARAVQARLDLDKLNNPREVQRLAERYLMNTALNEEDTDTTSSILAAYGWTGSYSV